MPRTTTEWDLSATANGNKRNETAGAYRRIGPRASDSERTARRDHCNQSRRASRSSVAGNKDLLVERKA